MKRSGPANIPPITQIGDPVLQDIAQSVPVKDITSPRIAAIIEKMKIALASQKDGVAIAAPQIGVPLRIFVVSGFALHTATNSSKKYDPHTNGDTVYINPKLTKLSREKENLDEGCLSVRWQYGRVRRSKKASVRAYNERGEVFERGASGLLAQIFQHETDHLEGVLFIDKATELQELPPEK